MRSIRATFLTIAVVASLYMGVAPRAVAAQAINATANVQLSYNLAESLTINVAGGPVNLASPAPLTISGSYSLSSVNHANQPLQGLIYITSQLAAGATTVPNASLQVALGNNAAQPCSGAGSSPVSGNHTGVVCAGGIFSASNTLPISTTPNGTWSMTNNINFSLVSAPTVPGAYTGTAVIEVWIN